VQVSQLAHLFHVLHLLQMETTENHEDIPEQNATDLANENDGDGTSFTVEIKSQVEQLIKSAKRQCEKEKSLMQAKYHQDIANWKSKVVTELNKTFQNDLLVPLKAKITENEVRMKYKH